jgi:hypothetical protein
MASRYYLNDRLDDAIACSDILSLPETANISPGALLVRRVLGAVAQFDKAMTVEPATASPSANEALQGRKSHAEGRLEP